MPYTPLEIAVMRALAWDLRDVVPDLAGQFEESLPGARRNTGHGSYTEMIVSPRRPAPRLTPSGVFGTVHAMVGDLPGSMAFKVRLREGVLLNLEGEAFDMETDQIDFATTSFHTVFTVDGQGKSIRFDPAAVMKPSPLLDLHTWVDPERSNPEHLDPPLVNVGPLQRLQDTGREDRSPFAKVGKTPLPKLDEAQTSLFIGICVMVAGIAILLWFLTDLPGVFLIVGAFWLCQSLRHPKALDPIARALASLQTSRKD